MKRMLAAFFIFINTLILIVVSIGVVAIVLERPNLDSIDPVFGNQRAFATSIAIDTYERNSDVSNVYSVTYFEEGYGIMHEAYSELPESNYYIIGINDATVYVRCYDVYSCDGYFTTM